MLTLALFCSCRPTDFFTEVIISPFADEVDEDNPEKTIINSPTAEEESDQLSALDWTENAARSEEVQSIVTYSDVPTTTLLTNHSIFDLGPRFPGVKSSDPVTLDYSADLTPLESETTTTPTESDWSADQTPIEGSQAVNQGEQTQSGVSDDGSVQTETPEQGEGEDPDASSDVPWGGMDGTLNIYNPNSGFAEVQKADHIAATGQAAVMVQALGGQGALCAIDANTYYGTGDTTASFQEIFGDELPSDFENTSILWSGDGSSAESLVDIDMLCEACGQDGVIVYDQTQGSPEARYTEEQRKELEYYNIQFVPVDFTTVQGMIDAATRIGDILSDSSCAQPAQTNASKYVERVSTLVTQAAESQSSTLAQRDSASATKLLSTYNVPPVTSYEVHGIFTAFGTSYVTGISYSNGSHSLDTESGLLFTKIDGSTPLSFWAQAAGVWDRAADFLNGGSTYGMLTGIEEGSDFNTQYFVSGSSIMALCSKAVHLSTANTVGATSGGSRYGDGFGSAAFPYLIVSASGGYSAQQVQKAVVAQIDTQSPINAYSALPSNGQIPSGTDANGNFISSVVGANDAKGNSAFVDDGVSIPQSVRANPTGLLGSWTEGSVESVLESVWLARIYSAAPENSSYEPICNLSKDELQNAVWEFYRDFYRMDASEFNAYYSRVVTDEGL